MRAARRFSFQEDPSCYRGPSLRKERSGSGFTKNYGMNPKSSGSAPAIGTSNSDPGPSESMVKAPFVVKKTAICVWASTATTRGTMNGGFVGSPTRLVKKVCGFFLNPVGLVVVSNGFKAKAKSLRKKLVRSLRSPERISAVAVGLGTVWSPRANWMITGFARSPGKGELFMQGPHAQGSP